MAQSIRNIAIIAHVDHGKTTLIDAILKQTAVFAAYKHVGELIMDSGDLEKERGITIRAKNASVEYQDIKINIVDTPGHADFGGEVERALRMVDGVILLIDAAEGPMPQTRFVLKKALELKCKPILVINKIDRPDRDIDRALSKAHDLFLELATTDDQLEFPVLYASGIAGTASTDVNVPGKDLIPLFEAIKNTVPPAHGDITKPLQFLALNLAYDHFKGRIAIGKVMAGVIEKGQTVVHMYKAGQTKQEKITELLVYKGLERVATDKVEAGDIMALAGIDDIQIGETVADVTNPVALAPVSVDEPTLKMMFMVNTSPFAGKEGKLCTSRNIKERLEKELETNVSLRVEFLPEPDKFLVSGRGELHLAVLIETMRREGYELAVSKPEVIMRDGPNGKEEPMERLNVVVPKEFAGVVIEQVGQRKGTMLRMDNLHSNEQELDYDIPTRGLIGLRGALMTATKGTAIVHHVFEKYAPVMGDINTEAHGSLISMENGSTTPYAIAKIEDRGMLFVPPQTAVYTGMVVGQHSRPVDIEVNPVKAKHLTNMRASAADLAVQLAPPKILTLEQSLEYIGDDELLEITPQSLRIRKKVLDGNERKRKGK